MEAAGNVIRASGGIAVQWRACVAEDQEKPRRPPAVMPHGKKGSLLPRRGHASTSACRGREARRPPQTLSTAAEPKANLVMVSSSRLRLGQLACPHRPDPNFNSNQKTLFSHTFSFSLGMANLLHLNVLYLSFATFLSNKEVAMDGFHRDALSSGKKLSSRRRQLGIGF